MKLTLQLIFILLTTLCYSQQNTEVFLFDIENKNSKITISNGKNISNNEAYDSQPSFLNTNTILFSGSRNGQTDIAKYTINTGIKTWVNSTNGSEYSPLKVPKKNAVSSIRLEKNGEQKLYLYNLKNGESKVLIDDIVIGYHLWVNAKILISSVLDNGSLSLYSTNLNKNSKLETQIGRSLHKIPHSNLISYISKKNKTWEIRSYNLKTNQSEFIINTLKNSEDFCWLPDGTILMGKNNVLYKFNPEKDIDWVKLISFDDYDITNITRLAVNSTSTKLVLVGEIEQTLEHKLENISWISGNWKGEAFGGITEENWSEPTGGSMMASFKLIVDGKVIFYEIEIIREVENTLILQLKHFNNDLKGWETKDKTIDFPLIKITKNKVVFEGMTFEKISDTEMNIYVDIHNDNGTVENVKFNYKKD